MASTPTLAEKDAGKFAPGQIAPSEGTPDKNSPVELGANNEYLEQVKPDLVSALRTLVNTYRTEGIISRRHEIRRIRQSHLYWAGIQYGFWSGSDYQWHLPFGTSIGMGFGVEESADAEQPRYQYVTNIYQAFGLSFIALMSNSVPTPVFYPQSAQSEQDITTAKAADDARELIEKNNKPKKLLGDIAWTMWCDGKVGGYVRYVVDGQRFGWDQSKDIGTDLQTMGEDTFVCPNCGTENPAVPGADAGFGMAAPMNCAQCGAELSDEDLRQAEQVEVPKILGTGKVPKGQEVISIIQGLAFHTPPWADEMHEFPYLQWNLEVHIAKLKAAYQHVASKIISSGPISADDVFARASRVAVKQGLPVTHPGDNLSNLVTFSRTWIRPWCFWLIEEEVIREELLKMFPEGCYVAFAGETYCESRNESMDDCWRVAQAMPGDGQNRPSVGDSMIQVQEQYNSLSNLEQESIEFGVPPIFGDAEAFDFDAMNNTTAEPGTMYPVALRANEDIQKKVLQLQPSSVDANCIERRQELMGPIGQFLTGISSTAFGGELGNNDTARAYELAREQAMGRIQIFWFVLKWFYADLMLLAIDCLRKNRAEDVELPTANEGGSFESKWLRLADLKGNIQVYDDPDETYPELPSQVRAMVQQLLGDEVIGAMLMKETTNLEQTKSVLGLRNFVIPGEDSRIKQLREIAELLTTAPNQAPPQMDPMTGAVQQGPPQSTVPIDPMFDDHDVEGGEIKRWANSDAGQDARAQNPAGFANVQAHYREHMQAAKQMKGGGANEKPPSESINYKDLPPDGQQQMASQAGIQIDAVALQAKQDQDKADKAAELQQKLGKTAPSKDAS